MFLFFFFFFFKIYFVFLHLSYARCFALQLNRLVTEKWVDGWDDPRLMTLAGLRRRGVSSTSINAFIRGIGITRRLEILSPVYYMRNFNGHSCNDFRKPLYGRLSRLIVKNLLFVSYHQLP